MNKEEICDIFAIMLFMLKLIPNSKKVELFSWSHEMFAWDGYGDE